jgi:hypothetical protein
MPKKHTQKNYYVLLGVEKRAGFLGERFRASHTTFLCPRDDHDDDDDDNVHFHHGGVVSAAEKLATAPTSRRGGMRALRGSPSTSRVSSSVRFSVVL